MSDETDIYRRQGFAQSVGFGTRPALLIVDFVVGFTDPAHFGGGNISPAIGRPAARACSTSAGRSAIAQPPFCGSSPMLTWRKQSGRRSLASIALPSAVTSDGRAREVIFMWNFNAEGKAAEARVAMLAPIY